MAVLKIIPRKKLFYLANKLTLIKTIGIIFLIGNDTGRPPHCGAENAGRRTQNEVIKKTLRKVFFY